MYIKKFKGYILNLILIWFVILLYKKIPYYNSFLRGETLGIIILIALTYTIVGLMYYIITPKHKLHKTKGELFFSLCKKIIYNLRNYVSINPNTKNIKVGSDEKIALLFILVKVFFLPIMINFVLANYFAIKSSLPNLLHSDNLFSIRGFNLITFPFLLAALFFIDTLWFAVGYATEAGILKNKIVSVEPTFFGWAVAIICYPPFNGFFTKIAGWYANDYVFFFSETGTFIVRIISVLLLVVYVGATLALGTKASNLTHRGIVSRGPYAVIRHPAYISKNLVWWLTIIPILSIEAAISMATWSIIYHFRSLTEERHLGKDPAYQEYCKKVKYKYIPGVY